MDCQEIRKKYACDDAVTKAVNRNLHKLKSKGVRLTKSEKTDEILNEYLEKERKKLGPYIKIYTAADGKSLVIQWSYLGTASATEALAFCKKLQQAVDIVRNAPKLR